MLINRLATALALVTAPLAAMEQPQLPIEAEERAPTSERTERLKRQMIDDLTGIKAVFSSRYAPRAWKADHLDWSLDDEYERACQRVSAMRRPSAKQFQRIVRDFLKSTEDYHVQLAFWATEEARLPFMVGTAEGRFFIAHIDREKLPERTFPFQVGDELITFDGQPVGAVVEKLRHEIGSGHKPTDLGLACMLLTHRPAALLPGEGLIPSGPVAISIQPQGLDAVQSLQLVWDYTPEEINYDALRLTRSPSPAIGQVSQQLPCGVTFSAPMMASPLLLNSFQTGRKLEIPIDEYQPVGYKRSRLPELGEVLWRYQPELLGAYDFNAYIYRAPSGKTVGFVRIPDYMTGGDQEVTAFGEIMAQMEAQADALVIDQLDNPGGSAFYLYALASHLSKQPLVTPRHVITITPEDVMNAKLILPLLEAIENDAQAREVLGDQFMSYPVDYTFARMLLEFERFMVTEWEAGRWTTRPFYLFGVDHINPATSGVFSKPILILTNEMDVSGGDFFPAILQDNGRALVVGTRTAGAGGFVLGNAYPNLFGVMAYTYTGSLALRPDQDPIENLGVTPDIALERTARDLQAGYLDYAASVNRIVEGLFQ
jgi:hypothetical protein